MVYAKPTPWWLPTVVPTADRLVEDWNRSHRVDGRQHRCEDGERIGECRRVCELARLGDGLFQDRDRGVNVGGEEYHPEVREPPDRFVGVAGGACEFDPAACAVDGVGRGSEEGGDSRL